MNLSLKKMLCNLLTTMSKGSLITTTLESFTVSALSAGGTANGNITLTKSGYIPVGVIGWSVEGSGATLLNIARLRLHHTNHTLDYNVRNLHTAQGGAYTIYVEVLWRYVGGVLRNLSIFKAFRRFASLSKGGGVDEYESEKDACKGTQRPASGRGERLVDMPYIERIYHLLTAILTDTDSGKDDIQQGGNPSIYDGEHKLPYTDDAEQQSRGRRIQLWCTENIRELCNTALVLLEHVNKVFLRYCYGNTCITSERGCAA